MFCVTLMFWSIVVVAALGGQTNDATADFSIANGNPNGVWTYGWSSNLTSALHVYPTATHDSNGDEEWIDPAIVNLDVPRVARNPTDTATQFVPAHSTVFHPGQNGEFSHFVWTSPGDNTLIVAANFTALDSGGTDVHVLQDGVSLFSGQVSSGHPQSFSRTITVQAGTKIDFAVGVGADGNFFSDTTGITATLTPTGAITVPATANIYGAGHSSAPNAGDLPPGISFPAIAGQAVAFPSVTGTVRYDQPHDDFGNGSMSPDGGSFLAPTDITETGGISGIRAPTTECLVGVFLSDSEPAGAAPATLDFGPNVFTENFDSISPKIGQVFFIGNGKTANGNLQTFYAPIGASRLFLGFADGYNGQNIGGPPGNYGDNSGQYTVRVQVGGPIPPGHGGLSATTFTVNESSSPVYPPAGSPVNGLADTLLRFAAKQTGAPAGLSMRVQDTTTPGVEASWTDLANATNGRMNYDATTQEYFLSSNDYPHSQADPVYFRTVASAPGYPGSISNVVGPFNLTSNTARLGTTWLLFTGNGSIADLYFLAIESATPNGLSVRVQATTTPSVEGSWADLSNGNSGHMTQSTDPAKLILLVNNYPTTKGLYFRAVSGAPGFLDSISNFLGPLDVTQVIPPTVTVQLPAGTTPAHGHDPSDPIEIQNGFFGFGAHIDSQLPLKNVALKIDGTTLTSFQNGETDVSIVTANIDGLHCLEAVAHAQAPNVGLVTGRAGTGAIWVNIVPSTSSAARARSANQTSPAAATSAGKTFHVVNSGGKWYDPATWNDQNGASGVPGESDLAIVGSSTVVADKDIVSGSVTLADGGRIIGPGTFDVFGTITITGGSFENSTLYIAKGAVCNLVNSVDVHFSGRVIVFGTWNVHGTGGLFGLDRFENHSAINFITPLTIPLNGATNPAAGQRILSATTVANSGSISGDSYKVSTSDGAVLIRVGLIGSDSAGLIGSDSAGIVAAGGGNIVAAGGGNIIAAGGGNIIAAGGGNIIGTNSAGIVAAGGGNIIAAGGGNFAQRTTQEVATASSGYSQSAGETNLSGFDVLGPVTLDGGTLSGSGIILGDLTNNGGFISPGHSAGLLAVTGNFAQSANGSMVFERGGDAANQFDQLQVSGAANLDGKVDVKTINGYVPDAADTFNPLGYSSVSGSFASNSSNTQLTVGSTGVLAQVNPGVANPSTGQPLNIATRLAIQGGDNVLIAGFIVTGPSGSTKKVLIRGLGPSLANAGISDAIQDPLLELHEPDGTVIVNDNWQQGDTSQIPNGFAPGDSRESVIVATLTPGIYTAVVKGAHGETGVGLAEIYDLESGSTAKLANIATRGFVQTGDNVLIGGFIIGGSEPAKVLVRAIGPSLAALGVPNTLPATTLEVHDANGNAISNDGWRSTQESDIIATTIPPSNDNEAAILATLVPGTYTAVVRGKNDTTGIAVIEAYNLQ
jgi:hypothetical protein